MLIVEAQPFSGSFYFPVTPLIHIIEISGQCFPEYFGRYGIEGYDRYRPETVCYQIEQDGDSKEDAGRSDFDSLLVSFQHDLVDLILHQFFTTILIDENHRFLERTGQDLTLMIGTIRSWQRVIIFVSLGKFLTYTLITNIAPSNI